MGFGSISHWVVILLIVVLLFGAKKIPELAKGVGKGIKTFKKEMAEDEPAQISKEDEKPAENVVISEKKEA